MYTFSTNDLITVGRIPYTDIILDAVNTSRLHAVIKCFNDKILIMDVGSYAGIILKDRSEDGPLGASERSHRRPFVIGIDETAIFYLGKETIIINPKECIIMGPNCTNLRNFRGQCGHFICCVKCAEDWQEQSTECPECRQPFFFFLALYTFKLKKNG